jgi:eukaryotic-like serine/threonine-protein kinase
MEERSDARALQSTPGAICSACQLAGPRRGRYPFTPPLSEAAPLPAAAQDSNLLKLTSRPPDAIPGYRLERLVGKGGMGEVHRAVQLSLGRIVAVKLLARELAEDPTFVMRFDKEAAALAALSHPNVVAIVDKGKAESTYYLVMEYVDGPSLREVSKSPMLDISGALRIIMEICRAIDYAHNRGVIHRDLKPENILFDEQAGGIPKVTDFGLATFFEHTNHTKRFDVTQTHVSMGTLSYMAPEQRVDAKNADHRADIYSLGVLLYELLVGEVPVGNFDPPSQKRPGVDKRIDGIVSRCLKTNPADRYQRVSELMTDLEPFAPVTFSQLPRKISRVEQVKLQIRRAARRTLRVAEALALLAALAILSLSWARHHWKPAPPLPTGMLLTQPDLRVEATFTSPGRIADTSNARRVVMGEGLDTIPIIAYGRPVRLEGRTLRFDAPEEMENEVGRAQLDIVDKDGIAALFTAEVVVAPRSLGTWQMLRDTVLGRNRNPQAALVLLGTPGRYVAAILSGDGSPVTFEWALGERRGTMLGPASPPDGRASMRLLVDRAGQLTAFFGTDGEQIPIGAPLYLGTDWKRHFGAPPAPQLGCVDAQCAFRQVGYEIGREPPDVPEPMVLEAAPAPRPSKSMGHGGARKTKAAPKPSKQAKR